jgi:hypothetical protein
LAVSFLKKAKEFAPPNSLKRMLHEHLRGMDVARPLSRIHASSLTKPEGFCPRFYALHDVMKKKPKDGWLTAADVLTFQMGHDLQDQIVNSFADMGKAIGHWKCLACDKLHEFQSRPAKCVKCFCKGFKPEEVRFESAVTGASAGIDMLVNMGGPKLKVVELKTMIKDQFKSLAGPLAEHKLRTNLYLRIIAESEHSWANMVDTSSAQILYTCKGGYIEDPELKSWGLYDRYTPFKEYTVTRNDATTEPYAKRSKVVLDFRKGEVGMPCGVCPTALHKRALTCSMKGPCFSGDYAPEYNWMEPTS